MQVTQLEEGGVPANLAVAKAAGIEIRDLVAVDAAFTFADESRWPAERDRFRVCVDVAAEAGASILYMTSGPAGGLTWDEAAARFTDAIAPVVEYAGWTDRDLEGALRAGVSQFAMVQVADYVLGTLCSADRAVPGDGDVPIQRHLSWLADAGYTGPIEIELLGPRISAEGPAAAGARAVRVLTELVEATFAG